MAALSSEQAYALVLGTGQTTSRAKDRRDTLRSSNPRTRGPKFGLPEEVQRLIWANVKNSYRQDKGATVLQAAWRRLFAIMRHKTKLFLGVRVWGPRFYDYSQRQTTYEQYIFERNHGTTLQVPWLYYG